MSNTEQSPSAWNRFSNGIGNFFRRIGSAFRRRSSMPPETIPAPEPISNNGNSLDDDAFFREYSDRIEAHDDIIVSLGLHSRVNAGHKYMYEMGRRDGSLGVKLKNLFEIARAIVVEMVRHIHVRLKGALASAEAEMDTRMKVKDYDEQSNLRHQAYNDYIQYQYRFFPRYYSFKLGLFYLLITVILLSADLTLALGLVRKGFSLSGKGDFRFLFAGDFWTIIKENWDTLLTAIGITVCTVFIKIYYDEFIGTPYANKLMTFRKFIEENDLKHHPDENLAAEIKNESRNKRIWKTILAIFTVLCLIVLAIFRMETAAYSHTFRITFWSGAAFVAITLLFPIIGGICMSVSFTNIQNYLRMKRAAKRADRFRNKYLKAVEKFTVAKKKFEDLRAADEKMGDEQRLTEEYIGHLVAFYERGYSIGTMQPDKYLKGEDFFTRAIEWRNIAFSRNISYNINKVN